MAKKQPKSLFRRLTKLFRTGPIPRRKIRGTDTTIAVADKTKSSGTLLFQKSLSPTYATITSNAYNLSERLMRYQDFQEMEYSVSFQTLIPTPDGLVEIGKLAKRCDDDPNHTFIVYSYDHEKKQIVPSLGKQARQTCIDHAWKVTFENGMSITASPEHRLMMRDGTYRKVEDLKPDDSMMPFYRKDLFANAEEGTNKGYSWVYTMDPEHRGWTKEHHLIAEWVAERKITEDECVHHINFVKTDNRPENLRIMTKSDHNSYHATLNNAVKWSPENTEWIEEFKKNHATWMRDNAPTRRHDVTFARILETCERVGFKISAVRDSLDVSVQLINERLVAQGFSTFTKFAIAYESGIKDAMLGSQPGLLTRDLSLDVIKRDITEYDTKRSLAIKLGCTVNVLDKFLARREKTSWSELRQTLGFCSSSSIDSHRNGGRPKGSTKYVVTFQDVCNAYSPGETRPRLAEKLGVKTNVVMRCLNDGGYDKWSSFTNKHKNHKVVSVEYVGEIPLFDLTVDGYKNFATDSVVSHNTPEIASAMDIYADETVSSDDKGRSLHIYSDNEKIKETLDDLFYGDLNIEFNLRGWARNLVKYGDMFLYVDVSPSQGVIHTFPIPVNEIEREENFDRDDPFAVRFRWVTLGNRTLENWEVAHFRLLGNDLFLPYGSSVIEPARRIWRQLILLEDAMLVYRVVRAPERRVFYIDVANIPPEDVGAYVEEQRAQMRTSPVVDRNTGRVDLRFNPLSVDEDFFIPIRGGETGTKIDTLAGLQNQGNVEDVAYLQKKLFAALKIPRAYLGYDEALSSKASLAQEDIRFSRTISVIQKTLLAELNKVAIIHLYAKGFDGEDLQDFTLRLSNPSTVAQQQKLELWRAKFEIAGTAPEGIVTKQFIRKEILGLNDDQTADMDEVRMQEKLIDAAIEAAAPEEGGGGGGEADLFGGDEAGGGGETEPSGGGEEAGGGKPPEENAGEEPEETQPNAELLTSNDAPDDAFPAYEADGSPVIKPKGQLRKALYNRSRHRTHGASKTHMPDFAAMTSASGKAMTDPYDNDFLGSVAKGLNERAEREDEAASRRFIPLSRDMLSMLKRFDEAHKKSPDVARTTLLEGTDVQDEVDGIGLADPVAGQWDLSEAVGGQQTDDLVITDEDEEEN